jgi:hypothetical protein
MENKKQSYETLDDIGFIGVQGYKLTPEDLAIFAQKGRDARRRCGVRCEEAQVETNNYAVACG